MALILDLLAREIVLFDQGRSPDYDLVRGILDYVVNYPDLIHHPGEDFLFDRLRLRAPDAAAAVGDLKSDHAKLGALSLRLAAAVKSIVGDEEIPRKQFVEAANDYLVSIRLHMQMEEVTFFPALSQALSAQDLAEADDLIRRADDPLFGNKADERYRFLHKALMGIAQATAKKMESPC